jgi:hypothetical protein
VSSIFCMEGDYDQEPVYGLDVSGRTLAWCGEDAWLCDAFSA